MIRHVTVFSEPGIFAGWPANQFSGQWGDEFLSGFLTGHFETGGMHDVSGPLTHRQARSLDGGETWEVKEVAPFLCRDAADPPPFNIEDTCVRPCGFYDHGGENVDEAGGFFLSNDRGENWFGPFSFGPDFPAGGWRATSRSCAVGDLVFVSEGHPNLFGRDRVIVLKHDGAAFRRVSEIGNGFPRFVMPSVARCGDELILAARCSQSGECWIECVASQEGDAWEWRGRVGETGWHNGNPPALITTNGSLIAAFGNRSECAIVVMESTDAGRTWSRQKIIRQGTNKDIGYPRLFRRSDGMVACVYYWSEENGIEQRIECSIFDIADMRQ